MAAAAAWWADRVGYQVYLRSFADSDGDGVGDLRGLHDRLEHLAWLGVGVVWITPFYPSPMRDHGYDVADYRGVEPTFGTLADLDAVVARAHDLDMKVVIDIVPNHTSSDHSWFADARSSRDSTHRDYYLWHDGQPDGGRPNNWMSHFGGPAWTFDDATGQWWCHLFLPEQPDLNWRNPAVVAEFDEILRFWLERGVDGFRIDVAHALVKHPDLPDLPPASNLHEEEQEEGPVEVRQHRHLEHIYDVDQPEVLDVYRRWRGITREYDALLLGEVYLLEAKRLARYVEGRDGLHLSFWFAPLHHGWDADRLRATLMEGTSLPAGTISWVQGSHDRMRAPSRFGGGRVGRARALAFATLLMGLPGLPFVYQGEELGMTDGEVGPADAQDPIAARAEDYANSRDGCRTPMLWNPGPVEAGSETALAALADRSPAGAGSETALADRSPGWGFTTAETAWLPFGDRRPEDSAAVQREDPDSILHRYRALIGWRTSTPELHDAQVEWLTDAGPVIAYRTGDHVVAASCGDDEATLPLPAGDWTLQVGTDRRREGEVARGSVALAPAEAVVLRQEPGA